MTRPKPLHSRIDLACEQLDVAIEIYFAARSFVSALTLAGAAEEILGTELKNRDKASALTKRYEELRRLNPKADLEIPTWRQFIEEQNSPRNAAKHIADKKAGDRDYDAFFRSDPETASRKMILRAIQNQKLLGLPWSELVHKYYGWHLSTIYSGK
jgi:hypothetical protein